MISIPPALGLLCLLLASSTSSAPAAPVSQMAERSTGFNPRQKWQVNEVNCVQILNPAPGATYHPGYFVRMNYGTGQCGGASAAGPWSIHLYNNPEIQDGGKIRYDYHEVIADGINEGRTQYTWNIPSDQDSRAKVRKASDYYVRVETSSADGVKLVGNAGPFAIYPDLHRRDESTSSSTELDAEFALLHIPAKPAPAALVAANTTPKVPTKAPIVVSTTTQFPAKAPVPATVDTSVAPTVPADRGVVIPAAPVPVEHVSIPTTGDSSAASTVSDSPVDDLPIPHNLPPVQETGKGVPVTPIATTSIIPSKAIMVTGITAGALVVGYGGGALFGAIGSALGAVVGGVVGGLAVLVSFTGLPV